MKDNEVKRTKRIKDKYEIQDQASPRFDDIGDDINFAGQIGNKFMSILVEENLNF